MSWTDGKQSYGWLSILLHWIGAVFVIALFLLGDRFEDMPRGPEKLAAVQLHASVGITAFLFLAARIFWRLRSGSPDLPPQRFALNRVAKLVQWLLLAAIAVLIVTGPLTIWTAGRGIEVFNLFTLPSPLPKLHDLHEALEEVHGFVAHAVLVLFLLHFFGALKHLLVDRDGVFQRMLGRPRSSGQGSIG